MESNLVSKSLENYLLKKMNVSDIKDLNLEKVDEISLNGINEKGEKEDFDFSDFEKLKSLKYLSLQNFEIKNFETNAISRCKNIEALQFSNCTIKSKSRLQNSNLKLISFDSCKGFNVYYISLLKKLCVIKLLNLKRINLAGIEKFKELEKIYFENERIIHLSRLLFIKKLIFIQLLKCKYRKVSEMLLSSRVDIDK